MTTATTLVPPTTRRLITDSGVDRASLTVHLRRHGTLALPEAFSPGWADGFLTEIEHSGLTGRGGGGFPAYRKLRIARGLDRPTLLVNAMEGEPASGKDRFLLATAPHLVLDGADAIASAIDAARIVCCVPEGASGTRDALVRALGERSAHRGAVPVEIRSLPGRFVTGEESALVAGAGGGPALPAYRPDKSVPLTLSGAAALVHNAETLAHLALIARHGAAWFREVGDPSSPGTALVTITGDVAHPGVLEVVTGTPLREILASASPTGPLTGVLVGGYGGSWVGPGDLDTPFASGPLRAIGASMGAGVIVGIASGTCGVRTTAQIARFMAGESAGQCGPCVFGLPAIAADLERIAHGTADREVLPRLERRCAAVNGRGGCRHPDGVVRLVRSALAVFADDLAAHLAGAPCGASGAPVAGERRSGVRR
jgi:NADH:ubiquinone oxidoreductase subunit F (NADH-binding)